DAEHIEPRFLHPREAEGGWALPADGLAVGVDQLREPGHAAGGDLHALDLLDLGEQRLVQVGVFGAERLLVGADAGVDPGVDIGEQVLEAGVDRVGEHERTRHEGDSDHDRDGREQESQLVGPEAIQCGAKHDQPPRTFKRSMTVSGVGLSIWSTTRPSERNTTRSAQPAATGSWVTMTMVWPSSRTARPMNASSSAPDRESRLPEGSSA